MSRFVNPTTLRAAVAVVAGFVLLTRPDRADELAGVVVGVGLVVTAGIELWQRSRSIPIRTRTWVAVAALLAGGLLIVSPNASLAFVGLVLGLVLLVYGFVDIVGAFRRREGDDARWRLVRGALLGALGVGATAFPTAAVTFTVLTVGAVWIVAGAIMVIAQVRAGEGGLEPAEPVPVDAQQIVTRWLRKHELEPDGRQAIVTKLFFEGAQFRQRLGRFAVLMALAVAISTFGLVSDSTAVVIGAMLIAPLMTPIMALAAALVMGWPNRALRSALTVLGGVVGSVVLAFLIATWVPQIPSTVMNSQVTSRVSPTMIDLLIALAAGAAGAFAISRPDVADSLPGVAVAVALVPPLSVIGLTLEFGQYADALGALLLFATNFVAIILAGSVVFVLVGFTPLFRLEQHGRQIRTSFATVCIGALLVMAPLVATGQRITADALATNEAESAVDDWLTGTSFSLVNIAIDGTDVSVVIAGPGNPPPLNELGSSLADGLQREVNLDLRVVAQEQESGTYDG